MGEVVNAIVAVAVIIVIFRWVTSSTYLNSLSFNFFELLYDPLF